MCDKIQNDAVLLIQIKCKTCHLVFYLCRSCFRGQIYCGEKCRLISVKVAHRKAQSRYRTSVKGREANRLAARRRRIKKREKSVADEGSTPQFKNVMMSPFSLRTKIVCLFCGISGKVVTRFPRRGYRSSSLYRYQGLRKIEARSHKNNPNDRRHHEYQKNIGSNPNSPDP